VKVLSENESTYIPIETRHRLENVGECRFPDRSPIGSYLARMTSCVSRTGITETEDEARHFSATRFSPCAAFRNEDSARPFPPFKPGCKHWGGAGRYTRSARKASPGLRGGMFMLLRRDRFCRGADSTRAITCITRDVTSAPG